MAFLTLHLALAVCVLALLLTPVMAHSAEAEYLQQKRQFGSLSLFSSSLSRSSPAEEVPQESGRQGNNKDFTQLTVALDRCDVNITSKFIAWFRTCQGKSIQDYTDCIGIIFCKNDGGEWKCNRTWDGPVFASAWYDCHGARAAYRRFQCGDLSPNSRFTRLVKFYRKCPQNMACLPSCSHV